jgi:hypothetical protein
MASARRKTAAHHDRALLSSLLDAVRTSGGW